MLRIIIIITILLFSNHSIANSFVTAAKSAVLVDFETGDVLFEKDAYQKMEPSSMSKLMTLYVLFEKLKNGDIALDSKFAVSENAWRKQGSRMFLELNSRVAVEDLIRGIVIHSGNDACITVAEGLMGSEAVFADYMNEKAKELGMNSSSFKNSTGWPDEGHLMSPYDLAILSMRIVKDFPEYLPYFSEKEFTYSGIKQPNRNSLLGLNIGVDGLKTGHTEIAGYGVAATAIQQGRRLIVVVNGLNSNSARTIEAEKLLQFGFLRFANLVIPTGKIIEKVKIVNGLEDEIAVELQEAVKISLEKEMLKKAKVTVKVSSMNPAPIEKGQVLGQVTIEIPGSEKQVVKNLIATKSVEEVSFIVRKFRALKNMIFGK